MDCNGGSLRSQDWETGQGLRSQEQSQMSGLRNPAKSHRRESTRDKENLLFRQRPNPNKQPFLFLFREIQLPAWLGRASQEPVSFLLLRSQTTNQAAHNMGQLFTELQAAQLQPGSS